MTIVETTVWIDYLANRSNPWTDWVERNMDDQELGLTDLIFCEVLQGFGDEKRFEKIQRRLSELPIFPTGGRQMALDSARNHRYLRDKGITVRKTVDCFIATFCIAEGHTLLHNDRDYVPFEEHLGLKVVHP
jgi:predicted nucleic acid-binding protein